MNTNELRIRTIREMLDKKEISVSELCGEYYGSIKSKDNKINAYMTVTEEIGSDMAKKAQEIIDSGNSRPLTGIPVAVKDNICTNGIKTTASSKMLENFIPTYNAAVINRLIDNGYVLLGKTAMDEFAMGSTTQSGTVKTNNPYGFEYVPGGSSGGSAACVAAGMAPIALGTDTGGSVRQPAAFCGVTGIKPTYGRISRHGIIAFASSLDQAGVLGLDAHDCAIMLKELSGFDMNDMTSSKNTDVDFTAKIGKDIKGLKIALPKEFFGEEIDSEVKEAIVNAAKYYESLGAVINYDVSLPILKYTTAAYFIISSAEGAANLSKFDGIKFGYRVDAETYEELLVKCRNEGFGAEVKRRILLGNLSLSQSHYDEYFMKAMAIKQETYRQYGKLFEENDVILTPTAPTAAFKKGSSIDVPMTRYKSSFTTSSMNLAGLPSISTTCGYNKENMPIGMSLTGKRFDESTIIQVADLFEREFKTVRPVC